MPVTPYAEKLIAKASVKPVLSWEGFVDGKLVRLALIDRNAYNRVLMRWPDGLVREMTWAELNRKFKAVGLE